MRISRANLGDERLCYRLRSAVHRRLLCVSLLQLEWRGSGSHLVALNAIPRGEILIQRRHRCRVERVRLSLLCCVMCRKLERSRVCE